MNRSDDLHIRPSPSCGFNRMALQRQAFTLIELLVVIIIISILSAMTLGGLANARKSSRTQTTTLMIRVLNDAIMAQYEVYEDKALEVADVFGLKALRSKMREEMPDVWADVKANTSLATTSAGKSYSRYKQQRSFASPQYQSAECLYMILTASGMFPDLLENVRPERVGDVDADGAKEFLDGWGNPIAFMRWAPGFSSPYSPIQFNDATKYHDPIDNATLDSTAFALYPLIYSPGVDGEYGLLASNNGWADTNLGITAPNTPCTFNPGGDGLVGAPNPASDKSNHYRDNITNHAILAQ